MAVTSAQFDEQVLKSETPALVDFWAEWCPPCKMIQPHVEALAEEYAGRVQVVSVDVDKEQELAEKYGVRSIPTLLFIKDGKVVDQQVGAVSKSVIASKMETLI